MLRQLLVLSLVLGACLRAQESAGPGSLAELLASLPKERLAERHAAMQAFANGEHAVGAIPDVVAELRAKAPEFDNDGCLLLEWILREHAEAQVPVAALRDALLEVVVRTRWTSRQKAAQALAVLLKRKGAVDGAEERLARALVPLLASQRSRVVDAGAAALAAIPGASCGADPFAARAWFRERFGSSIDLHAAHFEELLVLRADGDRWRTQDGRELSREDVESLVEAAKASAQERRRTFEVVLQAAAADVDAAMSTTGFGRFGELMMGIAQREIGITLAPDTDRFGAVWSEPSETQAGLRTRLAARIGELVGTRVPGAQVAIALPDGALLEFAHGTADRATKAPMTIDGRLLAGSIGKTFFSALALQLVGEGRIALDDPVSKSLGAEPWWKKVPNGDRMTLRHLLQHRSGLPRYEFAPAFVEQLAARPDHRVTPAEELAFVFDHQPRFLPGEGFEYADTNYVLLALVLEKVLREDCYAAIEARFLRPLALGGTVPSVGRRIPLLLQGHAGEKNPFGGRDLMLVDGQLPFDAGFEGAGGGFATTAGDLARWAQAIYLGPLLGEQKKELLDGPPAPLGRDAQYGCGSILQPTRLGLAVGHSGFFPGWLGEMRAFPDHGVAVAILVNSSADLRVVREMTRWVVEFAEAALAK
jgi:D-alanyl-D-alanine carboxypeptidase